MKNYNFNNLNLSNKDDIQFVLSTINPKLEKLTAEERITWGLENLPKNIILSSSFGIQSVVCLYLVTNQYPDIPVVLIDTGYLFPETYQFIDILTNKLHLNLQIFSSEQSPAWQEVRYGRLWEQGLDGIKYYNYLNKIQPMHRALKILNVNTWTSGLRRAQSYSRRILPVLSVQQCIYKLFPIIDWSDDQIYRYIKDNSLICHPLWDKGYTSVGDIHTTTKCNSNISGEKTRFFGLVRECGLHDFN